MSDILTRLLLKTDNFNRNLAGAKKEVNSFNAGMSNIGKSVGPVLGKMAAFAGVSLAIGDAVKTSMEFEKSLSSLRSLTGVTTQELSFFKEEAIRLGSSTTQTASQVVEAFKLIGSQVPELLRNKEALAQVTENAITLAEAAEIEVPEAAKALTGALNQMGESSNHAAEYINILAAASQQGSADIPYLNTAIEKAGGTASSVGVKFNQLVAAIEAIAPKITDASSAGTNLRNIFLTLESSADQKLRPSVVGLSQAVQNLADKHLNATQMTKMFGKESVTAALALVSEKDKFLELEKSITDMNTAFEQQRKNNDNLAGSIKGIQSAWEGFLLTFNQTNGILKDTIDIFTEAINTAREWMMTQEELTKKKYQGAVRIETEESNKRIQESIDSGMTKEQALDKETQLANRMYPEANAYQIRLEALKKAEEKYKNAKMLNINGYAREEAKEVGEMRRLVQLSEHDYKMRQAIYDNVTSQRKEMERIAKKQKEISTTGTVVPGKGDVKGASPKGSLGWYEEQISKEQKNLKLAIDPQSRRDIQQKIYELTKKKHIIELELKPEGSLEWYNAQISTEQEKLKLAIDDESRIKIQREIDELTKKKHYVELELKYSKPEADRKTQKDFADVKKRFAEMSRMPEMPKKINPIGRKDVKTNREYAKSLSMVSDSLSMLNQAAATMNNDGLSFITGSFASIAQMLVQLNALTTAKGVASAAELPFPYNLAAMATVVSTVASIFGALPKFASGGVVSGSSFFGDKMVARVNSGEMILNGTQQGKLFHMINNGAGTGAIAVDGEATVKGKAMYIAIRNYMKSTGKKW